MFEERIKANKPQYYEWEREKASRITIADLNEERIRGAIRLGVERGRMIATALTEPLGKVLDKLQLLTEDGKPNNAAAALFCTNIYGYTQFRIRMARFRGTDKNEFIDNQRAEGNFFDLLDAGMAFFFKHLSLSGKIVGFRREEHLEIPAEALRETLINALCHRQYEKFNLTIGIAIYDDRIEIESPGILPTQLTTETIKQPHLSYPYNPIIADVLFKATLLENWGSGASRIIEACKTQHTEEPTWQTQGGFIIVTFKRRGKEIETRQVPDKYPTSTRQAPDKYPTSTRQAPDKHPTSTEQELIDIIGEKELSIKELLTTLQLKDRENFMDTYLNPALEDGIIERKYPDQPKHPKQQYKLTEKALKWKNK